MRKTRNNAIEYSGKCKTCLQKERKETSKNKSEYDKLYYQNNKDNKKEKSNNYRMINRKIINDKKKIYYQKNKEKISEMLKIKYSTNINFRIAKIKREKDRYKNNKINIKTRIKNHRLENKKLYNAKLVKRRKNDITFGLKHLVSASIRKQLKQQNSTKYGQTILQYLPFTIQELKEHLERQFEPWMTWQNHGVYDPQTWDDNNQSTWTWQIDHIIPHSKFKYINMEDQIFKDCWALSNLRPYSAKQNIIDGTSKIRH